ncbi:MAG TPA: mechanosensitive ion channel domain-containing protein [Labilithrix sp.]|nr:mechanosensitive ion channel domain-containing protein [Labilithrix sp.]
MRRSYHGSPPHLSGAKDPKRTPRERVRGPARVVLVALAALVLLLGLLGPLPRAFAQEHAAPADAAPAAPPSAAPAKTVTSAAPAKSAAAAAAQTGEVRVHEKVVLVLRAPRAGVTAQERARVATAALEALLAQTEDVAETRVEETPGTAVVYVGKTPIVTLGPDDVDGSGEASLTVLAAQVSTRLAQAISTEKKRSAIATTVFSFSLLVFSALLAFLLFNRVSEVAVRIRTSIGDNPEKVTALRLGKIEFVSAGAARGVVSVGLALGYRFIQIALGYGWLIFALSLFEATKGYTERLTGMVVKPLYGLAARIGGALPLVVVASIAVVAVTVLVRFVGLFFDSITRGDTRVGWLSRDLARPTSVLARLAIIVAALVLGSPLITGENDGVIARVGLVALFAGALAATPLLASSVVGITVVFGRRMKRGDEVEVGGRRGKVLDVTLLDVRIEDESLAEVSVPHLLALFHPTRVHRHAALATLEVVVDPRVPQDEVEKVLFEAARAQSSRGRVELVYLDDAGAHWKVTSAAVRHDKTLAKVVQDALAKLGVGLGRGRTSPPRSVRTPPDDGAAPSARPEET